VVRYYQQRPDGENSGQPLSDAWRQPQLVGLNYKSYSRFVPGHGPDPADVSQMVQIVEASDGLGFTHFAAQANRSSTSLGHGRSQVENLVVVNVHAGPDLKRKPPHQSSFSPILQWGTDSRAHLRNMGCGG